MAEAKTAVAHKPIWLDLSSSDAAASRDFYSKLFGWKVEVNPDPQYGGYALGEIGGKDVAGIGPKMSAEAPTMWLGYIATSEAEGMEYTEFLANGESIAGGMEMNSMVPAQVPSYWLAYFTVEDVDKSHKTAVEHGAKEMLPPQDFPGGRFSILSDPQGASFGLL